MIISKLKIQTKSFIFLFIILFIIVLLDIRFRPIIKSIMIDKARAVAVKAVDNAVSNKLGRQNVEYSDIVKIKRSEN